MQAKLYKLFLATAGIILFITGAAKLVSSAGHAKILLLVDPIFSLQFRSLFILVGLLEIGVAVACFRWKSISSRASLVFGLATAFAAYRTGLKMIDYPRPCSCLGSLTQALRIDADTSSRIMLIVLCYLLIGSILVLAGLCVETALKRIRNMRVIRERCVGA
jgi:hypothetical protein